MRTAQAFTGFAVGLLVYLVLAVLIILTIGGILGGFLQLLAFGFSVVVGMRVYRVLRGRTERAGGS